MSQEYSFYEGHSFDEAFIRERIGQDLRERYEVPKGLPRKLRALVRRLDQWPKPVWSSLRRELHNRPPRSSNSAHWSRPEISLLPPSSSSRRWLDEIGAGWDAMQNTPPGSS